MTRVIFVLNVILLYVEANVFLIIIYVHSYLLFKWKQYFLHTTVSFLAKPVVSPI